MTPFVVYLVVVFYEGQNRLLRCALRLDPNQLKADPMDHDAWMAEIHTLLPLHVRSCGPVVEAMEIFEMHDATP